MQFPSDEIEFRLSAIVETSDDGIVSKDLTGIVQSWNKAAERMFGFAAHEMIGQSIMQIIPADRAEEELGILERLKRGERVDHFQTVRRRKDGKLIDVSVTISPILDGKGNVIGASKIARDVTEFLRLHRERDELLTAERAARGEAERANRMKDEFIATLSHELRTPLNAILGWAQLVARSPEDAETIKEGMEIIERNARAQTQLIEDLLDMGRIMSGKVRLDVQRVDVPALLESAVASIKPAADAKRIGIQTLLDPRAGPVSGDPHRLQQVVWNLLTNAVKFTPAGGRIRVVLERVESHVEITVSDTGRGITREFLPYVFERFRQADASHAREHGGLGIGLAIAKHLVELHGGRVRAESAGQGQGATFSIELPVAAALDRASGEHPTASQGSSRWLSEGVSLRGVKVLVVDDEADARQLLCRVLEECEAKVISAGSANEGMAVISEGKPDVLISDIGMPQKDGYEMIRELRRMPAEQGGRIPAIALTAFARPEDRTRALIAGYQMHIAKPVDAQELAASVASMLGRMG